MLPDDIVEAAMQGLRDAASSGPDGYPLEDVEVTLTERRAQAKARTARSVRARPRPRRSAARCRPRTPSRLEPIMAVEVTVDDEFLGAVIGDLNQRRGQVQDVGSRGAKRVVAGARRRCATCSATRRALRSLTEGRATFSMQFHAYDTLQSAVAQFISDVSGTTHRRSARARSR